MRRYPTQVTALALLGAVGLACDQAAPPTEKVEATCGATTIAPSRRLTHTEFEHAVRDLLGVDAEPGWPQDAASLGFDNQVEAQPISFQHIEGMMSTAEDVAAAVEDTSALLPCDPTEIGDEACGQAFVAAFAYRAYRRPVAPEELARLQGILAAGIAAGGLDIGIRRVIETVLQSPSFHHRFEVGTGEPADDGSVQLSGFEIASRLSFFLWASVPDEALLSAATDGRLLDTEGVRAEAERMLADPRARRGLSSFFRQWLRIDRLQVATKSAELFPEFDQAVADDLMQGTLELTSYVTFDSGMGDFHELFTTGVAAVSANTAPIYGVTPPSAPGFALVPTPDGQRAGILTDATMLAAFAKPEESSPVARGVFIREALLCQPLPSPPEDMLIEPPPLDPSMTTRERFAEHSNNPSCAGCHSLIDPPGFALEAYDAIGRYRASENGLPIDTTGKLTGADDANGPITDAVDLATTLADSDIARRCFTTQLTRFAQGHTETDDEACMIDALSAELAPSTRIRDIALAIVTQPHFIRRPAVKLGECQ
jgi:hypothetical protein